MYSNDDLKKSINKRKIEGQNLKKIPIKLISLDSKKNTNEDNEEDSDVSYFDQVEDNVLCSSDFKSKYNHDKDKDKDKKKLKKDEFNTFKRLHTEV